MPDTMNLCELRIKRAGFESLLSNPEIEAASEKRARYRFVATVKAPASAHSVTLERGSRASFERKKSVLALFTFEKRPGAARLRSESAIRFG